MSDELYFLWSRVVQDDLLELLRRQLVQGLQLAQALSVALVELEEVGSAVLQQVQDQAQTGGPGVGHGGHSGGQVWG